MPCSLSCVWSAAGVGHMSEVQVGFKKKKKSVSPISFSQQFLPHVKLDLAALPPLFTPCSISSGHGRNFPLSPYTHARSDSVWVWKLSASH